MALRAQDTYPCHIYCTQELAWINRWLTTRKEKIKALEELRAFAKHMFESHTFSARLKEISTLINNSYLDLAKPDSATGSQFNPVLE
jgi:hypothetical protein